MTKVALVYVSQDVKLYCTRATDSSVCTVGTAIVGNITPKANVVLPCVCQWKDRPISSGWMTALRLYRRLSYSRGRWLLHCFCCRTRRPWQHRIKGIFLDFQSLLWSKVIQSTIAAS
jgi:hypothetical protein